MNLLKMVTLSVLTLCTFIDFVLTCLPEHPLTLNISKTMRHTKPIKLLKCKCISNTVNSDSSITWKASSNRRTTVSPEELLMQLNLLDMEQETHLDIGNEQTEVEFRSVKIPLPLYYDSRETHSHCSSLRHIYNQGCGCRNSWAIAPASALSDRYCIFYGGTLKPRISAEYIMSCCTYCSNSYGCAVGNSSWAWVFLRHNGAVTGTLDNSSQECQKYKIPPCPGRDATSIHTTPKCQQLCDNPQHKPIHYKADKVYYHKETTMDMIQRDIFDNGPLTADMHVYEDFFCYQSGIYKHVVGDHIGEQTVKLMGWGEENGVKYWLAANSWSRSWGENGFFKIERGTNECNIEYVVQAGIPSEQRPQRINL